MLDNEVKYYMTEGGVKWQFTTALPHGKVDSMKDW